MFNTYAYNPGFAGSDKFGDVCVILREQMSGFEDFEGNKVGPSSQLFSLQMPIAKIHSGIVFSGRFQSLGAEQWKKLALGYAYQFDVGEGTLGAGLAGSWVSNSFEFDKLNPRSPDDEFLQDLKLSSDYNSFDCNAGVLYRNKDLYFGLSVEDILQSKYTSSSYSFSGYVNRHFYIVAGYEYQTSNQDIVLKPSFLFKNAGKALNQASLSLIGDFKKKFFAGLAYTTGNDVSGMFGVNFKDGSVLDGVRAGVSFDLITSALSKYGSGAGSWEFMVGYAFRVGAEKQVKSYKSVRFL